MYIYIYRYVSLLFWHYACDVVWIIVIRVFQSFLHSMEKTWLFQVRDPMEFCRSWGRETSTYFSVVRSSLCIQDTLDLTCPASLLAADLIEADVVRGRGLFCTCVASYLATPSCCPIAFSKTRLGQAAMLTLFWTHMLLTAGNSSGNSRHVVRNVLSGWFGLSLTWRKHFQAPLHWHLMQAHPRTYTRC